MAIRSLSLAMVSIALAAGMLGVPAAAAATAAPTITDVAPASVSPSGGIVTVYGAHLAKVTGIVVDGEAEPPDGVVHEDAADHVTFGVPHDDPGPADVTITTAGGDAHTTITYFPASPESLEWGYAYGHHDGVQPTRIACTSAHFCLAAADSGEVTRFDGTHWRAAAEPPAGIESIDCISSKYCVASLGYVGISIYDGTSWQTTGADTTGQDFVSCLPNRCLVVTSSGRAFAVRGSTVSELPRFKAAHPNNSPIDGFSCATARLCLTTVGDSRVFRFDGKNWTKSTDLAARTSGNTRTTQGVSCAAAKFCVVLLSDNRAATYDGRTWTRPALVAKQRFWRPSDDVQPVLRNSLTGVSCWNVGRCLVFEADGSVDRLKNSTWHGLGQHDSARLGQPYSLSCPSQLFCGVIGGGAVITYHDHKWADARAVLPANGYVTASCASPTFCMLVGPVGANATIFDGTSYTPQVVTLPTRFSRAPLVACGSPSLCAVSAGNDVATFDGQSWSPAGTADLAAIATLSCAPSGLCVAMSSDGRAVTFQNGAWSSSQAVIPSAQGMFVSCGAVNTCVATASDGRFATFDGAHWSAPASLSAHPVTITGLSCPTATMCMAVTNFGATFRYDGTGWTSAGGMNALNHVSCTSDTFCVALAYSASYVYDGTSWGPPTTIQDDDSEYVYPNTVTCGAPYQCLATVTVTRVGYSNPPKSLAERYTYHETATSTQQN